MSTAAIVLAAGSGSRFGATKQLAEFGGRPLVLHVVAAARDSGLTPVLVVVGHDGDRVARCLPPGVVAVVNPDHGRGLATSLRVGLEHLASLHEVAAAAVLLADEPTIASTTIRATVSAVEGGAPAARPRHTDRPGHPVVFAREVWSRIATVEGDQGARDTFRAVGGVWVTIDEPAPPDVDRTRDLEELRDDRTRR